MFMTYTTVYFVWPSSYFLETAILLTTETSAWNYNVIHVASRLQSLCAMFKFFPYNSQVKV